MSIICKTTNWYLTHRAAVQLNTNLSLTTTRVVLAAVTPVPNQHTRARARILACTREQQTTSIQMMAVNKSSDPAH